MRSPFDPLSITHDLTSIVCVVRRYPDMKPEVFQCIREIGNCLVFMQLLDSASRMVRSSKLAETTSDECLH